MTLYHSAPILLAPGSIIQPGNYGRIIELVGPAHQLWQREQALEQVRIQYFPDKPSRLRSTFSCANLDTARFYISNPAITSGAINTNVLYEVEKVDETMVEHRADFNVTQPLPGRSDSMEQIAVHYWQASLWTTIVDHPGLRCEELVTASPLRIIRRL